MLCVSEGAENTLWFYVLVRGQRKLLCKELNGALVLCVDEGADNMQVPLVLGVGKGAGNLQELKQCFGNVCW